MIYLRKEIIRKELGLIARDSIKIFQFVVAQYKDKTDFKEKYEEIVRDYNKKMK